MYKYPQRLNVCKMYVNVLNKYNMDMGGVMFVKG